MALINNNPVPATQAAVKQIASSTQDAYNRLLSAFIDNLNRVWRAQDPQGVIAAMGADAKDNFAASTLALQFLTQVSPLVFDSNTDAKNQGKLSNAVKVIKATTVNGDGTVTVNPPVSQ